MTVLFGAFIGQGPYNQPPHRVIVAHKKGDFRAVHDISVTVLENGDVTYTQHNITQLPNKHAFFRAFRTYRQNALQDMNGKGSVTRAISEAASVEEVPILAESYVVEAFKQAI